MNQIEYLVKREIAVLAEKYAMLRVRFGRGQGVEQTPSYWNKERLV